MDLDQGTSGPAKDQVDYDLTYYEPASKVTEGTHGAAPSGENEESADSSSYYLKVTVHLNVPLNSDDVHTMTLSFQKVYISSAAATRVDRGRILQ